MNMLNGKIAIEDGLPVFLSNSGFRIPAPAFLADAAGEKMVLGIRPEHTGEDSSLGPCVTATVIEMEPLGPHTLLIGTVGAEKFTAQMPANNKSQPDDEVYVYLDAAKMHFFRACDGLALRE